MTVPHPNSSRPPSVHRAGRPVPAPGADLRGRHLGPVAWRGVDLGGADLRTAFLEGADLSETRLERALLQGARLRGCSLHGTHAAGLKARDADLEGADLEDAHLEAADLEGAILLDARLGGACLRGARLCHADLRGADLRGADLRGAELSGAELSGADLRGALLDAVSAAGARYPLRGKGDPQVAEILRQAGATTSSAPPLWEATRAGLRQLGRGVERVGFIRDRLRERLRQWRELAETLEARRRSEAATRERAEPLDEGHRPRQGIDALRPPADASQPRESAEPVPESAPVQETLEATEPPPTAPHERAPHDLPEPELIQPDDLPATPTATSPATERALDARPALPDLATRFKAKARGFLHGLDPRPTIALLRASLGERIRRLDWRRTIALLRASLGERLPSRRRERAEAVRAGGPPGPGANLRGLRLSGVAWPGADLAHADLTAARLEEADLSATCLKGAMLTGARLLRAHLHDADLTGANLRDADLRRADLTGADLTGADLTGADLRRTQLGGARLVEADLTAARLTDLDLADCLLDRARLDQADLAGARWDEASVEGADLAGALGLSAATRSELIERGARAGEGWTPSHLPATVARKVIEALRAVRSPRLGRPLLSLLALAAGVLLAWRVAVRERSDDALPDLDALGRTDPLAAARLEADLAAKAPTTADRVGYLLEAAELADRAGAPDRAATWLREAVSAAGDDRTLASRSRIALAHHLAGKKQWAAVTATLAPVLALEGEPVALRAQALALYEDARDAASKETASASGPDLGAALWKQLARVPDSAAALHLALADLRAAQGRTEDALAEIDAALALDVATDLRWKALGARARILDRSGQTDRALAVWQRVLKLTPKGSVAHAEAAVALARASWREGDGKRALDLLAPLQDAAGQPVPFRAQALMLAGEIHQREGRTRQAVLAWKQAASLDGLDEDTAQQARLRLARALLSSDGAAGDDARWEARVRELLGDLPSDAAAALLAQARLGEAARRLDAGDTKGAEALYRKVATDGSLEATTRHHARAGLGDVLAQENRLDDAIATWRELLRDLPDRGAEAEHSAIELRIARALVRSGRGDEARRAYRALAKASDLQVRAQALLGLAEVARTQGDRARARSLYQQVAGGGENPGEDDLSWRVQARLELADLEREEGRIDQAMAQWRAVLAMVPNGDAQATDARLSMIEALSTTDALPSASDLAEAEQLCRQAVRAAEPGIERLRARLACAELAERAHRPALETFASVLSDALATQVSPEDEAQLDPLIIDAARGVGRTAVAAGLPRQALDAVNRVLPKVRDPGTRLNLLDVAWEAAKAAGLTDREAEVAREQAALLAAAPPSDIDALRRSAAQARSDGRLDRAQARLERALDLATSPADQAAIAVELGDLLVEQDQLDEADERYAQAEDASDAHTAFLARLGHADVLRHRGQAAEAARLLKDLTPLDAETRRLRDQALALALSEAGAPGAVTAWSKVADEEGPSGNADDAAEALKEKADALLADGHADQALALYQQVAERARDPALVGWARLGIANAQAAHDDIDEALSGMRALLSHPDREVATQAAIRTCQIDLSLGDTDDALSVIRAHPAAELGPGWDATWTSCVAAALTKAGRADDARQAWLDLANRWPDNQEAEIPAWLGLAALARDVGQHDEALKWANRAVDAATDPGWKALARQLLDTL